MTIDDQLAFLADRICAAQTMAQAYERDAEAERRPLGVPSPLLLQIAANHRETVAAFLAIANTLRRFQPLVEGDGPVAVTVQQLPEIGACQKCGVNRLRERCGISNPLDCAFKGHAGLPSPPRGTLEPPATFGAVIE